MVATSDLIQVFGISIGAIFALLTLLIGVFIWMVNRQDKTNERRHSETKESVDNLRQETKDEFAKVRTEMAQMLQRSDEENERRHQEVMKAIGLLYQHTHGEDGRIIIPIDGADLVVPPTVPAPADD